MLRPLLLVAAASLTLGACAAQTDAANSPLPTDRDCFYANSVNNYGLIDNRNVRITVGANRNYILTTLFNARDLDWTQRVAIRSTSGFICTGSAPGVEIIGGNPQRTFPVSSIAREPEAPQPSGS